MSPILKAALLTSFLSVNIVSAGEKQPMQTGRYYNQPMVICQTGDTAQQASQKVTIAIWSANHGYQGDEDAAMIDLGGNAKVSSPTLAVNPTDSKVTACVTAEPKGQ